MKRSDFLDKNTAIRLMNEYGDHKVPFIFIISFDCSRALICRPEEIDPSWLLFYINGYTNCSRNKPDITQFAFSKSPVSYEEYLHLFNKIEAQISYGNTYLLNFTCPTKIRCNYTTEEIFRVSEAKYKLWLKDSFVVFSPESFIRIDEGIISSYPMKGTCRADLPDAESCLMADRKEEAEHYTIVDLIRNDLNSVAKQVKVERFRYIERVETNYGALLQASSKITGKLPKDYEKRIGNILFSLLPAGSVSGAPKEKTVQIILETEGYDRGFYTGVFGYFDGVTLDSGVMIRFIESAPDGLIFKSGGGITHLSTPKEEYNEMIDKVYIPLPGFIPAREQQDQKHSERF